VARRGIRSRITNRQPKVLIPSGLLRSCLEPEHGRLQCQPRCIITEGRIERHDPAAAGRDADVVAIEHFIHRRKRRLVDAVIDESLAASTLRAGVTPVFVPSPSRRSRKMTLTDPSAGSTALHVNIVAGVGSPLFGRCRWCMVLRRRRFRRFLEMCRAAFCDETRCVHFERRALRDGGHDVKVGLNAVSGDEAIRIGAAHHREPQAFDVARRERTRPSNRRVFRSDREPVVIRSAGLQTCRIDFDGVVA
jgi:hypothetical protein